MKDIQYFLDVEDKYCRTIPEEVEVWDEEAQEWDYKRIPLDFLRSRPFHQSHDNLDYNRKLTKGYDLNDAELTILGVFFMHCPAPFRDDYYTQKGNIVPEIAKEMFEVLNSAVSKAPITNSEKVYRHCKYPDIVDLKVGDSLVIPHNLTCTTNLWPNHDGNIYAIRTLSLEETRAHDIYRMYTHNENERQVNFLRGTRYQVTDIQEISGTEYHVFNMDELKQ